VGKAALHWFNLLGLTQVLDCFVSGFVFIFDGGCNNILFELALCGIWEYYALGFNMSVRQKYWTVS
jgi:hypothetical protein